MKENNFLGVDLSTYNPEKTMPFYSNVFGWEFRKNYYADDNRYDAYIENQEITSIYETPQKFKDINMPHFWMGYIQVDSVDETVEVAKKLGGIIEAVIDMEDFGKLALIRDLQGAGFTIYEGDDMPTTRTQNQVNTIVWNELHVSDAEEIISFYESIFSWMIVKDEKKKDHYNVYNSQNEHIADILQIPNKYKGKYEYWVCTIAVENLKNSREKILNQGGIEVFHEGDRIMMTDNSQEAFFYIKEA